MKKIVYKVIMGDYDYLEENNFSISSDIEYWCFTDQPKLQSKGWKIVYVDDSYIENLAKQFKEDFKNGLSPFYLNRHFKIFPEKHFHDVEYSVYVDGHIIITKCLSELIDDTLKNSDWAGPPHRNGGNIFIEAVRCYEDSKITLSELKYFISSLEKLQIPSNTPFPENGVIVRRHNSKKNIAFSNIWWRELLHGPQRDQLHWQKAFVLSSIKFNYLPYSVVRENEYYRLSWHKRYNIIYFILFYCIKKIRFFLRSI
ncbi:hypothetical protein JCM14469_19720 [Desulfatiferula olefinivorans]